MTRRAAVATLIHRFAIGASLLTLMMPELAATEAPSRPTVQQLQLENGLQLVWEEDHRQPLIAIDVRIKGGLRGEGRRVGTGITHFIEHMLFKGTPSRPPGTIEQEVRRYGGTINAFTSMDSTGVSLFVEAASLRPALELVADILQHAIFDQREFDKERAVIISEIQMNLDDPERRLQRLFWNRHYLEHPYRHPILGYRPLLERLTVADLADFYAAQYQPQNIVIACVGDLQGRVVVQDVQAVFGAWPRGLADPGQQVEPAEPPAASAKDITEELAVQAAYVQLGFPSVRLADPELYPLDVLASIVGQGQSSRLYETVVRRQQLAHQVAAWNYTPFDPGIFGIGFRTDPDKVDAATQAILRILDDVKARGVTDAELRKAKQMVSADYLFNLQTIEARAGDLAQSLLATGDPLFSRRYVAGVGTVTRQDVQAAARRYCDALRMTTAVIRPRGAAAAPQATQAPARTVMTKRTLDNGVRVVIGVDRTLPIVALVAAFRGGIRVETEDSQGLSNLVASMLTKGTRRRTALQIAEAIESLGGRLEPFSGRDGFGLALQVLAQDAPQGLALLQELLTESTFPDEELDVQRRLILKELAAQDDEIFQVGGRLLRRTLFGPHPYRFVPLGDEQTVGRLTRAQCLEFVQRWLGPSNMVVALIGDVDPDAAAAQAARAFSGLLPRPVAWPAEVPEEPLAGVRDAAEHMDKEQALVMLGFRGTTHTAEDREALDVMTAILSGMAGRLFQSVREQHGLSYTLGAAHAPGWDPGHVVVYAATRPAELDQVLRVLREQLERVVQDGFTAEEVEQAKRYLIGLHRMDLQHLAGLARQAALDELFGLGFDAWIAYEARVNAVTPELAHAAAKRYLTLGRLAQVVISPNGAPAAVATP